jgi:formate hydrogenlyase subunit 3/multisubunit Na+/H+ antiporter MnhD subunit
MNATVQAGFLTGSAALLASAIVTPFLAGRRKLAGWLGVFFAAVAGAAYTAAAAAAFGGGGGPSLLDLGFLRIHLLIDGFSALFLALISLMGALAALYSVGYMEHYADYRLTSYCVHCPLFLLGMAGIVTVDDLSTGFTIAWQLMTISSFFLIRFDHKDRAIVRSANRYLLLMEAAWALIVVGGALLSRGALGEPLHRLTEGLSGASASRQTAVYALLLVGFGLKAGVFPLGQLWLPDAHSSAPSPVSALLSGVMIKTGVYGIVRTLFWMFPPSAEAGFGGSLGVITAAFGAVTLFIGTVQALKQHDAKRLHAYHSIGQMGYILLGIGSAHAFLLSGEKASSSGREPRI